jgi:hypothetical protein
MTLDVKYLQVNIPVNEVLHLKCNNIEKGLSQQIILLLNSILYKNYFQYHNIFYKSKRRVVMGSPISGNIAEIFL